MARVFPSKMDTWLKVVWIGASILSVVACFPVLLTGEPWLLALVVVILLLAIGVPTWMMTTTRYTLDGKELRIQSGPFRWRVPVGKIESITPTNNPLSSPALSLDRLEIRYGKGRTILVSPSDKEGFLDALRAAGMKTQ